MIIDTVKFQNRQMEKIIEKETGRKHVKIKAKHREGKKLIIQYSYLDGLNFRLDRKVIGA